MNDEHELNLVKDEEATDVPVTPERPQLFVYPKEFTTERGEIIEIPWPGFEIEIAFSKKLGEILKMVPQLRGIFNDMATGSSPGIDPSDAAADLMADLGLSLEKAVSEVPELVCDLVCILSGLEKDQAGKRLSIFGDGFKLISYFIAKEFNRLGQVSFNIKNDTGFSVPSLADVAVQTADRGLTGETPNG